MCSLKSLSATLCIGMVASEDVSVSIAQGSIESAFSTPKQCKWMSVLQICSFEICYKLPPGYQLWQKVATFTSKCQESPHVHSSNFLNAHLKAMHGLSPNRPIAPWLIQVLRDVAVTPHKCSHKDLRQHSDIYQP